MSFDFPPVWLVISAMGIALMAVTFCIQIYDAVKHLRKPMSKKIRDNQRRVLWRF